MLTKLRQFFGRTPALRQPSVPHGERVYAIGDLHGRLDLFDKIIAEIEEDDAQRGRARTTVVLLGDLIDRGPDSAAVIRRSREWAARRRIEFLQGNHEEMLLTARTKPESLKGFLKFGGYETLLSYGLSANTIKEADAEELQALMLEAIPAEDFDFLDNFEKMVRIGDYAFVHAGVRPDTPLEHQFGRDCRWIREPFLSHRGDFGAYVVHGHTITEEPEMCSNRVGIDTGAYLHGTLTAIGLQGTDRWFIQAHDETVPSSDAATPADAVPA